MPTLLELQREFLGAVLDGGATGDGRIISRGIDPARRLGIYANTARTNFIASLQIGFPVTLRLVGAEYFDQCALAYRAAHPSRSGDLNAAGALFPDFLIDLHAGGEYRYLGDVARLEWLCQESLMAADAPRLDPLRFFERLAAVAPERYDGLRFVLHPAVRLFVSDYPASEIWTANLGDDEPEFIDLAKGGERLLIARAEAEDTHTLNFHRLTADEHAFVNALEAGADFATAMERTVAAVSAHALPVGAAASSADHAAGDAGPPQPVRCTARDDTDGLGFDAVAALRRLIAAEAIMDFQGESG